MTDVFGSSLFRLSRDFISSLYQNSIDIMSIDGNKTRPTGFET